SLHRSPLPPGETCQERRPRTGDRTPPTASGGQRRVPGPGFLRRAEEMRPAASQHLGSLVSGVDRYRPVEGAAGPPRRRTRDDHRRAGCRALGAPRPPSAPEAPKEIRPMTWLRRPITALALSAALLCGASLFAPTCARAARDTSSFGKLQALRADEAKAQA